GDPAAPPRALRLHVRAPPLRGVARRRPLLRLAGDDGRRGEAPVHHGRLHRARAAGPPGGDVDRRDDPAAPPPRLAPPPPAGLRDRDPGAHPLLLAGEGRGEGPLLLPSVDRADLRGPDRGRGAPRPDAGPASRRRGSARLPAAAAGLRSAVPRAPAPHGG